MSDDRPVNVVNQQLTVSDTREPGVTLRRAFCDRLEKRITELGEAGSSHWLSAVWGFFGVAVSAALAALALPSQTEGLGAAVRPSLWATAIAAAVIVLVCLIGHFSTRAHRAGQAADIVRELRMHVDGIEDSESSASS